LTLAKFASRRDDRWRIAIGAQMQFAVVIGSVAPRFDVSLDSRPFTPDRWWHSLQ
jgi:hypothetical protein